MNDETEVELAETEAVVETESTATIEDFPAGDPVDEVVAEKPTENKVCRKISRPEQ